MNFVKKPSARARKSQARCGDKYPAPCVHREKPGNQRTRLTVWNGSGAMQQDRLTPERAVSISDLTAEGNGTSGWGRRCGVRPGAGAGGSCKEPARNGERPRPAGPGPAVPRPPAAPSPAAAPTALGPAGSPTATGGGVCPSRVRPGAAASHSPEGGAGPPADRTQVTLGGVRRAVRCLGCGAVPPCGAVPFSAVLFCSVPCCSVLFCAVPSCFVPCRSVPCPARSGRARPSQPAPSRERAPARGAAAAAVTAARARRRREGRAPLRSALRGRGSPRPSRGTGAAGGGGALALPALGRKRFQELRGCGGRKSCGAPCGERLQWHHPRAREGGVPSRLLPAPCEHPHDEMWIKVCVPPWTVNTHSCV